MARQSGNSFQWRPTPAQKEQFDEWRTHCVGYLISNQNGIRVRRFNAELDEFVGDKLPLRQMGLPTVNHFLYQMADAIEVRDWNNVRNGGREELLIFINEGSIPRNMQHIRDMVKRQAKPKTKKSAFGPIKLTRNNSRAVRAIELLRRAPIFNHALNHENRNPSSLATKISPRSPAVVKTTTAVRSSSGGKFPSGTFGGGKAPVGTFGGGKAPTGTFGGGKAPPGTFGGGKAPVGTFGGGSKFPPGTFGGSSSSSSSTLKNGLVSKPMAQIVNGVSSSGSKERSPPVWQTKEHDGGEPLLSSIRCVPSASSSNNRTALSNGMGVGIDEVDCKPKPSQAKVNGYIETKPVAVVTTARNVIKTIGSQSTATTSESSVTSARGREVHLISNDPMPELNKQMGALKVSETQTRTVLEGSEGSFKISIKNLSTVPMETKVRDEDIGKSKSNINAFSSTSIPQKFPAPTPTATPATVSKALVSTPTYSLDSSKSAKVSLTVDPTSEQAPASADEAKLRRVPTGKHASIELYTKQMIKQQQMSATKSIPPPSSALPQEDDPNFKQNSKLVTAPVPTTPVTVAAPSKPIKREPENVTRAKEDSRKEIKSEVPIHVDFNVNREYPLESMEKIRLFSNFVPVSFPNSLPGAGFVRRDKLNVSVKEFFDYYRSSLAAKT